ncbi:type III secretion system gatekeeper subunit SctW [Pseudothauera rhizosphaerae]|nr:type III secretion system gatekeeper subunit SctW [Pseudothauera rhizosphaerae]
MRIDGLNSTPLPQDMGGQQVRAQVQTGAWRGESVQVSGDGCDILTDAAEEITMSQSEKAESKKLNERKISNRPSLMLPRIEQIQQYLEKVGKGGQQYKLQDFVATLKNRERDGQGGGGGGGASPREEARRQFGNVTEQFLALSFAVEELSREGGHEKLVDRIREDLEDLSDDFGGHIRADLNTVGVAGEFGRGDPGETERFQAGYRDSVLGGENLSGMLRATLEHFGEQDFGRAVEHMIRALGDDLAAMQGSSAEPTRLNAVLQDLYLLEVLSTVLDSCRELSERMHKEHGIGPIDPGALMQDLVAATGERWTTGGRFVSIAEKHGVRDLTAQINFLTTVKVLAREMPVKVFVDPESRFNVVGAIQEALDDIIAQEEE